MISTAALRIASPFIMAAVVLGVYALLFGGQRPPAPRVTEDPVPWRNCAYPLHEGDVTVMVVVDGQFICWRMK